MFCMDELCDKKIIGLMSGTSCDSIDAGLCIVHADLSCELIEGINYDYTEEIRAKIFEIFKGNATTDDICKLNFVIAQCFADTSNVLIEKFGKPDLIASHGQTIFHFPFNETLGGVNLKSTLQIG